MASSKRDLKRKCKKEMITSTVVEGILLLYFGLLLGAAYLNVPPEEVLFDGSKTFLDAALYLVPYFMESPFGIWPSHILGISTTALIWLVCFMYNYQQYVRKYNTMYEDAYGSGGFNDDLEEYYREYVVDPSIVGGRTKKNEEGKKVTVKRIYPEGHKLPAFNCVSDEKLKECLMNAQIYSKDIYLSLNAQWTRRNLNAFYLGASGTGKSRFAVKPNLLSANSSFVVTDPSAEILKDCGGFLESQGYVIKVLNLKDLSQSNRYNPMAYINKVADIPVLTNCMLANLDGGKSAGNNGGENKFWTKSTLAIVTACTAYQFEVFCEDNEFLEDGVTPNPHYKGNRNYVNVMRMLRMAEIHEDEGGTISDLDRLFAELAEKNHKSYAVKMYQTFKMAPDKTALNILISTAVELGTFFDNDEFSNLAFKDEMDIESIGQRKTAVFIITPEGETTYNFFAAMFYTQLFQVLYKVGEKNAKAGGDPALKIPVRIFLDEMANVGHVPQFNEKLSTMRKYRISCVPIFQSLAQLKTCFKDDWEVVIGNCDTMVFLGGAEPSECEMLSKRLGKMSIRTYSYGTSKNGSSDNQQQIGREVLTADEIERMKNNEQLVFIRGVRPFCTEKYTYENHPNYKYTAGSGRKESITLDMERFNIAVDYEAMERTYVYALGDEKHVEPVELAQYKGVKLPMDNFSVKLDNRTMTLTEGRVRKWRDTIPRAAPKKTKTKKENPVEKLYKSVEDYSPLNDEDKRYILDKLQAITRKQFTNLSEADFKVLMNIKDDWSEEELAKFCMESFQFVSSYSPFYEFVPEKDFLIGNLK